MTFFQSVVESGTVPQLRKMLLYDVCEDFKYAHPRKSLIIKMCALIYAIILSEIETNFIKKAQ